MFTPYRALHQRPKVPDQPVDPGEASDEVFERNNRNWYRRKGIEAVDQLEESLDYLSDETGMGFQNTLKNLDELRDYLERDLED